MRIADAYWKKKTQEKDWECVAPDLPVYKYSGVKLKEDPRRTPEYRKKVVDGLGFGQACKRTDLTSDDFKAVREVLTRKTGAFWINEPGVPRTTLRHLLHDTIPIGPPCRTPPHRRRGEEADWIDQQL